MGRNLNRFALIGRLGDFPVMKYTNDGLAITRLRLAVSNDYFNKDTKEWVDRTDWIDVAFFANSAERLAEKATKGDVLYVECSVHNNNYESKSGDKVYSYNFKGWYYELIGRSGSGQNKEEYDEEDIEEEVEEEEDDDEAPPWGDE